MHIGRVDLNLYVVFDAIYSEGSITRAASKLNLTQPAVSHALSRLREVYQDALFVRRGNRMVPTPQARSMVQSVREALLQLQTTLTSPQAFDPASWATIFCVMSSWPNVIAVGLLTPANASMRARWAAPPSPARLFRSTGR